MLLFDVQSRTIISKHKAISDAKKPVTSLFFGPHLTSALAECSDKSPRSDSLSKSSSHGLLYAVEDDSSLSALVYYKEAITICGPWKVDSTSKVLHHCCFGQLMQKFTFIVLTDAFVNSMELHTFLLYKDTLS